MVQTFAVLMGDDYSDAGFKSMQKSHSYEQQH